MELYHKKINIGNQNKKGKERNIRTENNPKKNIYIQKIIKQSQPKNEAIDLSTAGANIHNIRTNMEEIFSNDENKNKAIKYVIEVGKNKNIRNSPKTKENRIQKSVSPFHHEVKGPYISGNVESFQATPNRNYYDSKGNNTNNRNVPLNTNNISYYGPNTVSNFYPRQRNVNNFVRINNIKNKSKTPQNYNDEDEYYDNQQNYNNINPEESQNEYELSSMNNADDRNFQPIPVVKYSKSPDPRILNRIPQVLNERYQNAERQQNNRPQRRNKDIQIMPKSNNQINNYNIINPNIEDEMNELVKTVENLESIINGQKNEIKNNRKEIKRKIKKLIS